MPSTKAIFISPSAHLVDAEQVDPSHRAAPLARGRRDGGCGGIRRRPRRHAVGARPSTWPRAARAAGPAPTPSGTRATTGSRKPEHDELARLVGRDAARLEVEQLRLVDRADRARMRRAAAVRLVDLERRDGDRAGRLRQVHPELAEEAVGADGRSLDRDEALEVGPGRSRAAPPWTAGRRSCRVPTWVVYEVRSKSCSSLPNTISTCSTELRSPTSRLSTRLRTSRPPSWASAHCSDGALADRRRRGAGSRRRSPAAPGGWRSAAMRPRRA